jgi:hypothetical protein
MKKLTISVVVLTVLVAAGSLLFGVDYDYWGYFCDRGPAGGMQCNPGTCQDPEVIDDPVYGTNCAAWCSGVYYVADCNKKCIWSICATAH